MEAKDWLTAAFGFGAAVGVFFAKVVVTSVKDKFSAKEANPRDTMPSSHNSATSHTVYDPGLIPDVMTERTRMLVHEIPSSNPIRLEEQIKGLRQENERFWAAYRDERTVRHTMDKEHREARERIDKEHREERERMEKEHRQFQEKILRELQKFKEEVYKARSGVRMRDDNDTDVG